MYLSVPKRSTNLKLGSSIINCLLSFYAQISELRTQKKMEQTNNINWSLQVVGRTLRTLIKAWNKRNVNIGLVPKTKY